MAWHHSKGGVWIIDKAKNIIKPTGILISAGIATNVGFPAIGDVSLRIFQVKNLTSTKGKYTVVISELA